MKKIYIILLLLFFTFQLQAQLNKEVNELSSWYAQSEHFKIPDSILTAIKTDSDHKGIPANRQQKQLVYFRAVCNDTLPVHARIKIANQIIENFSGHEAEFPLDIVQDIKKQLLTKSNWK